MDDDSVVVADIWETEPTLHDDIERLVGVLERIAASLEAIQAQYAADRPGWTR